MPKVVIKRRIDLDFLGKEYKDCYLIMSPIPVGEYDKYISEDKDIKGKEALKMIIKTLEDKFISGKFVDENGEMFALTKENLKEFDGFTANKVFAILTGQELPPKGETS